MQKLRCCDKCGEFVPFSQDAVVLEVRMGGAPLLLAVAQARHLMPTARCEGSPSRRQRLDDTPGWREAWEAMQSEGE